MPKRINIKIPKEQIAGIKQIRETNQYESFSLWLDYWYQMALLKETNPRNILEVGKGTGTLQTMMQKRGYVFKTVDFAAQLSPDFVGTITNLPLKDNSFDTTCSFQVLEHISFKEVLTALKELKRVSKKYIVISVPYACFYLSFAFQPFYATFLDKLFSILKITKGEPLYFNISIPFFFLNKYGMIKEHQWELGRRNYPVKKLKKVFRELNLEIVKEADRIFYPYHRFFLLKKKS